MKVFLINYLFQILNSSHYDTNEYKELFKHISNHKVNEIICIQRINNNFEKTNNLILNKNQYHFIPISYKIINNNHYRFFELIEKINDNTENYDEMKYLELLNDILLNGDFRQTRNGFTYSLFGRSLKFNLKNQFPLLTTKKMFFRGIIEELLFFIRGETDSKILENKNINIWKGNTSNEFIQSRNLNYREGDMGPMYGFNWIHYGVKYEGCDKDYGSEGINQIQKVIELIKNDPSSRRILMTTFNPSNAEEGVLYPCHGIVVQFYVREENNKKYLSCIVYIRSNDMFLGSPFNISSYAALVYIFCKELGDDYYPDELIMNIGDVHIYEEHINACLEQIERTPYPFPQLEIKNYSQMKNLKFEDFVLHNYKSFESIKAQMKA